MITLPNLAQNVACKFKNVEMQHSMGRTVCLSATNKIPLNTYKVSTVTAKLLLLSPVVELVKQAVRLRGQINPVAVQVVNGRSALKQLRSEWFHISVEWLQAKIPPHADLVRITHVLKMSEFNMLSYHKVMVGGILHNDTMRTEYSIDGDLRKTFWFPYFLFFWFSITVLWYTSILPISQLQTQQVISSQIRSHTAYLMQTYCTLVLSLQSKLVKNSLMTVFNTI